MKKNLEELLETWEARKDVAGEVYMKTEDNDKAFYNDGKSDAIAECIKDVRKVLAEVPQEYNPSYIKGEPERSGWYIAALMIGDVFPTETPLFFNMSAKKWCTVEQTGLQPIDKNEEVVAYMPLPKYKL